MGLRLWVGRRAWTLLGLGWAIVAACSSSGSKGPGSAPRNWVCTEATDLSDCSCDVIAPGSSFGSSRPEVSRCAGYACCLLTDDANAPMDARCECSTSASCAAEAASRPGTTVVPECPPKAEQAPVQCAAVGVNCTAGYLRAQELESCCDGLICRLNDSGVRTCESATPDEIALARQCKGAPANSVIEALDPLTTSNGTMQLDGVRIQIAASGPNGCLTSFEISSSTCTLHAQVSSTLGTFAVSGTCGLALGGSLTGTATFEGVSCDGGLIFESYCYAGTVALTLGGAPARLVGTFCTVLPPSASTCSG